MVFLLHKMDGWEGMSAGDPNHDVAGKRRLPIDAIARRATESNNLIDLRAAASESARREMRRSRAELALRDKRSRSNRHTREYPASAHELPAGQGAFPSRTSDPRENAWRPLAARLTLARIMAARATRRTSERNDPHRADNESLLADILSADDREHCPGARPVVSFSDQDEREYLRDVHRHARRTIAISRRGVFHGEWAELDAERIIPSPNDASSISFANRWHSARPIVLPGVARDVLRDHADDIQSRDELHARLKESGGLRRWLDERASDLEPRFERRQDRATLYDRERDIERWLFESHSPTGRGRRIRDLWVKSSWLSSHEADDSLRVRVSFGREERDDASGDLLRHRLVATLAGALFPEAIAIETNPELVRVIGGCVPERLLFTQHIAYWNSPEGGALFHHDAFAEDADSVAGVGQVGVCYVQLSGATAWLALSIGDLARRVREFAEAIGDGALPWVRAQLFPNEGSFRRFEELVADQRALLTELGLPGSGKLGALVNRGPEFTSFLADAGHASILDAGDAILLPNHGVDCTAMHSVFSASDETAYSLSLALRLDREMMLPSEGEMPSGGA
jgi:hypothetical protein